MKTLPLSTYDDRRRAERSALSETVRRAMNRVATCRLEDGRQQPSKPMQIRDALHRV
jgi:hypothetical protein